MSNGGKWIQKILGKAGYRVTDSKAEDLWCEIKTQWQARDEKLIAEGLDLGPNELIEDYTHAADIATIESNDTTVLDTDIEDMILNGIALRLVKRTWPANTEGQSSAKDTFCQIERGLAGQGVISS